MRNRLSSPAIFFAAALIAAPVPAARPASRHPRVMHAALARLADPSMESYAINDLGFIHAPRDEVVGAMYYFIAALKAKKNNGDLNGQAKALQSLGVISQSLGDNRKGLEYLVQSLSIYRGLGDRRDEAIALDDIAVVHSRLGEAKQAIGYFEQSLVVFRELGIRDYEASTLNNLGQAKLAAGERQAALSLLLQSLKLRRAIRDRRGEAQTLNNIGALYDSIGEQERALTYFKAALDLRRVVGDHYGEAHVLNNIGVVQTSAGRYSDASDRFKEALALLRAAGDRFGEAGALNNVGVALASTGHPQAALESYGESLRLRRSIGDPRGESLTLYNIALAHLEIGETDQAIGELQDALSIGRRVGDLRSQAVALHALAGIERDRGNLPAALSLITDGVEVVESMRGEILSEELRVSFAASAHDVQEFYIEILMELHRLDRGRGYDVAALEASEGFRARALLGALSESRKDRAELDPALLDREKKLRKAVNSAASAYTHLLVQAAGKEALASALAELEREKTEYAAIEGEVKQMSSANAVQPPSLTADELRSSVIDSHSALIEYSLGEERSYLWLVTAERVTSFELPPRMRIEAAAQRVYELLTARNRRIRFETAEERIARVADADAEYWRAAAQLSTMLLGPIQRHLAKKQLLVVPDGALFNVPFSALPDPRVTTETVPLIVEHEVVVLPSASTLARLRSEIAGRPTGKKLVAVIADPVYSRADPRLRSLANDKGCRFQRLPFAREEATAILSLVPRSGGEGAFDFQASRQRVLSEELGDYRYVHFATHAYVDNAHPEVSALVLSLVDEHGHEQDGFLRLYDIVNLNLSADLVVLSGCRTGLGRQVRGEGVIGLARGFFYAGAARLVVSLWDVNDRATAELMKNFYQPILGTERLSPSAALRAVQVSMWKQPQWRAPYYWASFVLSGEPR